MDDFREKLILTVTEASVGKVGVDMNTNEVHAQAIIKLVDSIIEESKKKAKK